MSQKSTFCAACIAATLLVATIGMAGAMDYSTAMSPNGELGFAKPAGVRLGIGFPGVPDIGNAISNAISVNGNGFTIGNFRDIPAGAMENLASIKPVSERKGG